MIEVHRIKSRLAHARAGMAFSKGIDAEGARRRRCASGNSDNIRFAVVGNPTECYPNCSVFGYKGSRVYGAFLLNGHSSGDARLCFLFV